MSFIRKIKKPSGTYLARVESYRQDGKVKQRVIEYLGIDYNGTPHHSVRTSDISVTEVRLSMNFQAIHALATELGLPKLLGEKAPYILLMVYSHLVENLSIQKMGKWITKTELPGLLEINEIGANTLYHALDSLDAMDWGAINDAITAQWFGKYKESKQSAIIIDVTDTYFNGSRAGWKKRKGKDGKYDKLVQIGLAVSAEHGLPLKHRMYEGNIGNSKIMADFMADAKMLGMQTVIIDRGMSSFDNLDELSKLQVQCIAGIKANTKLGKRYIDSTPREEIYSRDHAVKLKETVVYAKSFQYLNGKLLLIFNPEIEVSQKNKLFSKETTTEKEQVPVKYYGYSFIYHSTQFATAEVVRKYFEKDIVEKSFHQIKGVLSLHPFRLRILDRISAHIKICFLSFCILSLLKIKLKKLGISPVDALDELSTAYKIYLKDDKTNFEWSKTVTLKKIQEKILQAVGLKSM